MPANASARELRFLDPAVIARLGTMELKARTMVEGFLSGLHRSPYRGFSVEFAEYRQYLPGDDLSTLDWKVYARSDRHYVKQYQEETNLPFWQAVTLVVVGRESEAAPIFRRVFAKEPYWADLVPRLQQGVPIQQLDLRVHPLQRFGLNSFFMTFNGPPLRLEDEGGGYFRGRFADLLAYQQEPMSLPEDLVRFWVLLYYQRRA